MQKRRLGSTNLEVSVVGFGGIPIQRFDQNTANEVLTECMNQGMNFIDTARGYGASEELIGLAIEGNRDKWIIATKSPAKDYESMKQEIETSLQKLRTDYIDLYQCHFIRDEAALDLIMAEDGAYKALLEAKAEGKIKHIGATCHNKDTLELVIETGKFETIQFPFNFIENQGLEAFKKANEKDMGILVMKPIAGGAIDRGEVSIKYILNNPHITVAIPGMETTEKVRRNAEIGSRDVTLSEEEQTYIRETIENLGDDFCRRCGYCAPCPEGIDIAGVFGLNAYLVRYNMPEWAKQRYAGMTGADKCTKCGACEPRCPYDLPIREMLLEVVDNFK